MSPRPDLSSTKLKEDMVISSSIKPVNKLGKVQMESYSRGDDKIKKKLRRGVNTVQGSS